MPKLSRAESRRRAIVIRFMFQVRNAWVAHGDPVDRTWIVLAVHLGTIEGRPLDVSSIAELTRIPRASVQRHLDRLRKQGRVEMKRQGRRSIPVLTSDEPVSDLFTVLARAIQRAASDLSDLGS